jgi:hypothetical protein
MKKIVLTVVAMLSMTMAFAKDEDTSAANDVQAYNMELNYGKLADCLCLSEDQEEVVEGVHKKFCAEMMKAAAASKDERKGMMDKAITKDLRYMHCILRNEQYRKYLQVLNATINNRGLNK